MQNKIIILKFIAMMFFMEGGGKKWKLAGLLITSSDPRLGPWGCIPNVCVISLARLNASRVPPTAALTVLAPLRSPSLTVHILYRRHGFIKRHRLTLWHSPASLTPFTFIHIVNIPFT